MERGGREGRQTLVRAIWKTSQEYDDWEGWEGQMMGQEARQSGRRIHSDYPFVAIGRFIFSRWGHWI
jgi:hypothetical protein